MVKWTNKIWGKTRNLIDTPFYSKHELCITAGTYCSLHYHQHRANRFLVVSGNVEIIEMYGPRTIKTMLGPDNMHDVPSLVPHMFVVYKSGAMIEEYYSDRGGKVLHDDIVRIVEGGKMPVAELSQLPLSILNLHFHN